jgi:hypothetical protein
MSAMGTPAWPTVARKRPHYLGPTNAAFKSLSRMGIRVGVVQVLTVPGRASGQPRSTPVSPVPLDGRHAMRIGRYPGQLKSPDART